MAVQRDGVGILHQPRRRADHAGNADADGGGNAQLRLGVAHQGGQSLQRFPVAVRRGNAVAQGFRSVGAQHRNLDLRAAQVDADAMMGHAAQHEAVPPLAQEAG